ncbi:unnamed protein product [Rhizophagus irregularis]|uniref:Uncharacterized protein n=1 Tax=Rhizophagus irregularis TaxID=588596 RepID=A0A2N1MRV8_9GLOM|nr:hypothetical protein RhiirC2_787571 [Rhizophagus irregularis]CAB4394873.1 unnamed protein product [Rhizophagus irregularis]
MPPQIRKNEFSEMISLTAKRYREGTEDLELLFEQIHNENVGSSFEQQPLEKTVKKPPKLSSLITSNPLTVEITNTSRPVILTISSFSQNTNVINVTINYNST